MEKNQFSVLFVFVWKLGNMIKFNHREMFILKVKSLVIYTSYMLQYFTVKFQWDSTTLPACKCNASFFFLPFCCYLLYLLCILLLFYYWWYIYSDDDSCGLWLNTNRNIKNGLWFVNNRTKCPFIQNDKHISIVEKTDTHTGWTDNDQCFQYISRLVQSTS